jgi:hypothetical protein
MLSEQAKIAKKELEDFSRLKRGQRNLRAYLEEIIEMGRLIRKSDALKVDISKTDSNPEKVNFWAEKKQRELGGIIGGLMANEDIILSRLEQVRLRDKRSYEVLFSRYLLGKSYEQIQREIYYQPTHLYRLLGKALEMYALTDKTIDLKIFEFNLESWE